MTMTPFVPEVRPRLSGGGLTAAYIFSEAHFHWGDLTAGGSEHTKGRVKKKIEKVWNFPHLPGGGGQNWSIFHTFLYHLFNFQMV